MNHPLNPRQKNVLSAIVNHYIVKAEPVSSRILSMNPLFQASSATLRNTMAELEDLGLVEQPHKSAGRTPTDRGYRAYVDELMMIEELPATQKQALEAELGEAQDEQDLLSQAARILGQATNLLGVAVSPSLEESLFQDLSVVQLPGGRMMLILSVSDLVFRTMLVDSGLDTSIYRLEAIARRINERMKGRPVSLLNAFLKNPTENPISADEGRALGFFNRSISKLFDAQKDQEIRLSGTKNILSRPDFERIEDLESILEFLDSKIALVHFLRQRQERNGVHVTIGEEHREGQKLRPISIVTSAFTLGGGHGVVGVIGPKRMPYSKLISIVDFMAKTLSGRNKQKP